MFVWILMAMTIDRHFFGPTNIGIDALVFSTAEQCLDRKEQLDKSMAGKHDEVTILCVKKETK